MACQNFISLLIFSDNLMLYHMLFYQYLLNREINFCICYPASNPHNYFLLCTGTSNHTLYRTIAFSASISTEVFMPSQNQEIVAH